MFKKNKLLVGCLALLLVLSVGYALFSETIEINGTATAKGNFAFEIETMKGINDEIKSNNTYALLYYYGERVSELNFENEDGIEESSISHTTNTITYSAPLTNQGQMQYFTAKITNTGSIPMVFDIYYDFTYNSLMTGNVIMRDGSLIYFDDFEYKTCLQEGKIFYHKDCSTLSVLEVEGSSLYDIFVTEDIFNKLNTELENGIDALPIIETGESIYVLINPRWSNNINFQDENIVGIDMKIQNTITLPVKQYTVN